MPTIRPNPVSNPQPLPNNPSESGRSPSGSNRVRDRMERLPRGRSDERTSPAAPTSFFGRIAHFFSNHERATAAVMLGATALPMLAGAAGSAIAAPVVEVSNEATKPSGRMSKPKSQNSTRKPTP